MAKVDLKTYSVISPKMKTDTLPQPCQRLFNETEKLISSAEKQHHVADKIKEMKQKLLTTQQQLLTMEKSMQQKSCNKALVSLKALKKAN